MYTLKETTKFRKDVKRIIRQGKNIQPLTDVINILLSGAKLDDKFYDHPLHGNLEGFRECHITSDWLLVYAKDKDSLILTASRTGSHSEVLDI